jgi:regulator of sirC expression with transglutaminase-like and TPR domain
MDLDMALAQLANDPTASLDPAAVALLVARDEYPRLDVEAYLSELAGMAHEVRPRLRGPLEARVRGLCRYLFHEMGFRGNPGDTYYDPRNSFLNDVLDRKKGIPITLSLVAMAVAGRAGLPVVGVGLPGHFIAKAVLDGDEVLFDPFHGGRLLSPEQCEALVERVVGEPFQARPELLEAVPTSLIVVRMLNNLKSIFLHERDYPRAIRTLERLRQVQPGDVVQRRDLGVALAEAGQPGPAIDHLAAYLDAMPGADDAKAIRKLLQRTRKAVARWN